MGFCLLKKVRLLILALWKFVWFKLMKWWIVVGVLFCLYGVIFIFIWFLFVVGKKNLWIVLKGLVMKKLFVGVVVFLILFVGCRKFLKWSCLSLYGGVFVR